MSIGKFFLPQKFHKYLETDEPETKGIINFIFGRQYLRFASQYPPNEAAQRLKKNIIEAPFLFRWWWQEDTLMGKVAEDKVKLMWVMGQTRNSFNPIFTGKFTNNNGGAVLEGFYSIHWVVKIFLCIWFGGIGLGSFVATFTIFREQGLNTFTSVHGIGLLIFLVFAGLIAAGGLGLVAFGKRIAIDSLHSLTKNIEKSIT